MKEKVIIIGGGPAGLSASIYASRANLTPVVFAGFPPGGQLTETTEVENFPGHKSILGPDLITAIRDQAISLGAKVIDANVKEVDFTKNSFSVTVSDIKYETDSVIIATGAKALWLNLENETRLRGRGVSACATCDGFFFKGKNVAIVGGGDTAMEEAMTLSRYAAKVYIIHRKDFFRASKAMQEKVFKNKKIEVIWNTQVKDVLGENKVSGLLLNEQNKGERELVIDGLFVAIGHKPDTELFKGKVALDEKGYILTGTIEEYAKKFPSMTSIPGVFAAGDCVDHLYRQAITAAGMGVAAALDVERYLTSL